MVLLAYMQVVRKVNMNYAHVLDRSGSSVPDGGRRAVDGAFGRDDMVEEDVVRLVRQVVDNLEFVGDTDLERAVCGGEEAVVPSAAVS